MKTSQFIILLAVALMAAAGIWYPRLAPPRTIPDQAAAVLPSPQETPDYSSGVKLLMEIKDEATVSEPFSAASYTYDVKRWQTYATEIKQTFANAPLSPFARDVSSHCEDVARAWTVRGKAAKEDGRNGAFTMGDLQEINERLKAVKIRVEDLIIRTR